jgi:hypothetical protein
MRNGKFVFIIVSSVVFIDSVVRVMKCATLPKYYFHLRTTFLFDWNTPVSKRKISLVNTNKEIAIIRLKISVPF